MKGMVERLEGKPMPPKRLYNPSRRTSLEKSRQRGQSQPNRVFHPENLGLN
jgi:hypothetical protein